jgi:hypothetical protein
VCRVSAAGDRKSRRNVRNSDDATSLRLQESAVVVGTNGIEEFAQPADIMTCNCLEFVHEEQQLLALSWWRRNLDILKCAALI